MKKCPRCKNDVQFLGPKTGICAECYASDDLVKLGSEQKIKEAGLYRQEGKEYIVQTGDVILFRFNV